MAPEQFTGAAQPASDLYALGVTLLYVMTGMCEMRHLSGQLEGVLGAPSPTEFRRMHAFLPMLSQGKTLPRSRKRGCASNGETVCSCRPAIGKPKAGWILPLLFGLILPPWPGNHLFPVDHLVKVDIFI